METLATLATDTTPPFARVTTDLFRNGMAHLAGAVNVITTDGPGGRAGFTATAVCSVTDTPPTLLVCLNKGSSAAGAFAKNTALCVNTIASAQSDVALAFGGKTKMDERFERGVWSKGASGAPILAEAAVSFDCEIMERKEVGTHVVLFAEVLTVALAERPSASIYFARNFHGLGEE